MSTEFFIPIEVRCACGRWATTRASVSVGQQSGTTANAYLEDERQTMKIIRPFGWHDAEAHHTGLAEWHCGGCV